jgi:peptidoglycan/LPS O-acetylase OafA/YrhL
MHLKYRADIDGLRAIAVLSVVFNHAGILLFHGGYIGVDIFFVISGYLITGIIVREINASDFSLVRFYERRIRRIYPALFVTILFTVLASAILYSGSNFRDFGKSVLATTFFFSNIHFWTETGYFDGPAQIKPLLHTWSLAVEEQFYIVFPLLLFLLASFFRKKILHILTWIALSSFFWSIFALHSDPSGAFYFAHLRAWELLIGGLLALNLVSAKTSPTVNNVLALIGIGMIIVPTFLYTETTGFPGFAVAIPVLGTALIIYCGTENPAFINRLLSIRPLVFVGKISYSLYLWHWPVIIFAKYYAIKKLTFWELGGVIFFTLILSVLSWKFIETPFREKKILKGRSIFVYAASVMIVAAVAGSIIYFQTEPDKNAGERVWSRACNVNQNKNKHADNIEGCPLGDEKQRPSFLLLGDSHARAAAEGISLAAYQRKLSGELVYSSGCPFILGITRRFDQETCKQSQNAIMEYVADHPEIKTIILAGRWAQWAEGSNYSFTDENPHFNFIDTLSQNKRMESSAVLFERGFERTIMGLLDLNRNIVIINQVPEIGYNVELANFIAQRTGRDTNKLIALPIDKYYERNRNVFQVLNRISEKYNIQIVDPSKVLCNKSFCLTVIDKQALYEDDHHLSVFGSEYVAPVYNQIFQKFSKSQNH